MRYGLRLRNFITVIHEDATLEDRIKIIYIHVAGSLLHHLLIEFLGLYVGRIRGFGKVVIDDEGDDKGEDDEDGPLGDELDEGEKNGHDEEDKEKEE